MISTSEPLMNNKAHHLLTITRKLKGVQLGQFESLIEGSEDLDDYNPTALRQIEDALTFLLDHDLMDEESYTEIVALSVQMRLLSD